GEDESSVGGLVDVGSRDVGSRDAADRGLADSDGQADYRGGRLPVCGAERGTTSPDSYAVITAWVRSRRPSLARTRLTCVFTVWSPTTSRSAISVFERPSATSVSTSTSHGVS